MKLIHPAAWAGLILNALMFYLVYSSVAELPLEQLPAEQREILQVLRHSSIPLALAFCFALQVLAVWMVGRRMSAGIAVACVFSFILLPFSLVYILGVVHTLYNARYSSFAEAPPGREDAVAIYESAQKQRIWPLAAITSTLGIVLAASGQYNFGIALLCCGVVCAYMGVRMANAPALMLRAVHLVMSPQVMGKRIMVPYKNIRKATLFADQAIRFDIETPEGLRELKWSLKNLPEAQRREALEQLAAALRANNVTLV